VGSESEPPILAATSILVAARDGFYWARTDRYEILRLDSLGAPVYVIRRPVEPEELGSSLRDEYRAGALEGARRVGGEQLAQGLEARLRNAAFAETRPLFGGGFVDHDGRLWVSDLPWPSRYDAPRRWSVFSDQGQWLGDVEPPANVDLHDAAGDRILGVWTDEVGVQYVDVYHLMTG
jgi:hypothetical protein